MNALYRVVNVAVPELVLSAVEGRLDKMWLPLIKMYDSLIYLHQPVSPAKND